MVAKPVSDAMMCCMQKSDKPRLFHRLIRFFLERILRVYYAARHPETPKRAMLALLFALLYLIFPLDFIPDFLLPIGLTDDAFGLLGAAWWVSRYGNATTKRQARVLANRWLSIVETLPNNKPDNQSPA